MKISVLGLLAALFMMIGFTNADCIRADSTKWYPNGCQRCYGNIVITCGSFGWGSFTRCSRGCGYYSGGPNFDRCDARCN